MKALISIILLSIIKHSMMDEITVETKIGTIKGVERTIEPFGNPLQVRQFLGVPYAEPPVGELRFEKPVMKQKMDGVYDATKYRPSCFQLRVDLLGERKPAAENNSLEFSNDCLVLNIFTPGNLKEGIKLPVMILIHGGGFVIGTSTMYPGHITSAYGNVIVVTINYRLGLFGFLSTGDKTVPGNAGLWDQRLALQWVHTYIESFGGDKGRVTVVGGSAGAISTMLQGFMPDNHGLFQRIITQSGSISMPVNDMEKDVKSDFKLIATTVGCLEDDISDIVACLRGKSVEDLLSGISPIAFSLNFSPIIDGDFLKINPQHISRLSESERLNEVEFFRSLDILSGFNAYEGVFFLPFMLRTNQIEDFTPSREEMSNQLVPNALNYLYKKQTFQNEITKLVEAQHTTWTNPSDSDNIRLQLVKIIGDGSFCVPAIEISRLHKQSTSSRNFMYHFTPNPSYRRLPMPSWLPGSTHADEVPFMFGSTEKVGVGEENAWELVLLTNMVTYWTNFIKSGDPNRPTAITPHWPEYNLETGDYLKLEKSMSNSSAGQYFYEEEANFWLHVFPDLVNAISKEDGSCDHDKYSSAANSISFVIYTLIFGVVLGLSCFL